MARQIIIGDIHGLKSALVALLVKLNLRSDDQIIFVGDLVDKGPDSVGVVRYVRDLTKTHDVVLVEGNHEEKHRRFRKHVRNDTGVAETMRGADELKAITEGLNADDVTFLETAVLYHRIPEHGAFVAHAGIPSSIETLPLYASEVADMSNKQRKRVSQLLRVRYLSAETGKMVSLGDEKPGDPYWADVYDGRFGHVFFGHQHFMVDSPVEYAHATALDLGAVYGGRLAAAVLNGTGTHYVTVEGERHADPQVFGHP